MANSYSTVMHVMVTGTIPQELLAEQVDLHLMLSFPSYLRQPAEGSRMSASVHLTVWQIDGQRNE